MSIFNFKLRPVLDRRVRTVRRYQQKVGVLQYKRIQLENRIREYGIQIEDERRVLREQLIGGADIPKARLQAYATVFLTHQADSLVHELANVMSELEEEMNNLATASSQKRALTKLEEKRYSEWRTEQQKRQQAELDDLVSTRFEYK